MTGQQGVRVLVFSADIGEGHDLPARVLADAIREREPDAQVEILDSLRAAGPLVRTLMRAGAERVMAHMTWIFDAQYWLVARWPPSRWVLSRLGRLLAGPGLLRAVAAHRPDVVVSTYPGSTEVLGALRATGRLHVPLVAAITDLAALRYWAHPGCDVHLVIHPESVEEVQSIAGARTAVVPVRGLTGPAFEEPRDAALARAALGLPGAGAIVLVSGGGWAVGDLAGAVSAALEVDPTACVVTLCGRNEDVRERLAARFGGDERVRVLGFTDRMGDFLAAADVLVHSTAGLTVLEALVRGARVISYGWGVGHIRINNEAYRRLGLAAVAGDREELRAALRDALASPADPDVGYGRLPAAADLVLDVARR